MEKMTYVAALTAAIDCEALPTEVREKLTALREKQANRKPSGERKPTKHQLETAETREKLVEFLREAPFALTISGIIAECDLFPAETKTQTVTTMLTPVLEKNGGEVHREMVKGKAFFSVGEGKTPAPAPATEKDGE